ncbi:solute carrier family 13 member 3 [Aplysia californica]|uniref:Solute carrier family 13 member 3 n=1 Tax=Aplysia californica TaxID=6500 RepID=A0ABM0JZT5_APLCA|nr:solute carrier family 13 member 3 [Aplysia californica]
MSILKDLLLIRKVLIVILVPLVCLPLALSESKEMTCSYGVIIMAVFWITEALPIPVTAFCSVIVFPITGIITSKDIARVFFQQNTTFIMVTLCFALAVEKCGLHTRVALFTLKQVGTSPRRLLLGFMLPTWFLSMWISNTSTTAMMMPIVLSVIEEMKYFRIDVSEQGGDQFSKKKNSSFDIADASQSGDAVGENERPLLKYDDIEETSTIKISRRVDSDKVNKRQEKKAFESMCTAFVLSICYSSSVGGGASLTGTLPNIIMASQADEIFASYGLESNVNFLTWFVVGLPISVVNLIVTWSWLSLRFFGVRSLFHNQTPTEKENRKAIADRITEKFDSLGPMTFAEIAVCAFFLTLVSLWLSIKTPNGGGWGALFTPGYVTTATVGVIIIAIMFLFPSECPTFLRNNKNDKDKLLQTSRRIFRGGALLDWKMVQERLPWGVLMLMGGGLVIAKSAQVSGLSKWIGVRLEVFSSLPPWLCAAIMSLVISFMTEISNGSTVASIICPILGRLAQTLGVHPLLFLFPGTMACSYAFMLPVACAPNNIAYSTGLVPSRVMMTTGFVLDILCVLVLNTGINTYTTSYLDLTSSPFNATLATALTSVEGNSSALTV